MKQLFACLLLTLSGIAQAQAAPETHVTRWTSTINADHPLAGKVYDLSANQEIDSNTLLSRLTKADTILIGEKHDNPDHHMLEQLILKHRLSEAAGATVVFEMLDDTQQDQIASVNASYAPETLPDALNWNGKAWPWEDYGSVITEALDGGASLVAGNISRAQLKSIYAKGNEELNNDAQLRSALKVDQSVREELLDEIYEQHCQVMARDKLSPMVNIQLARDAHMASAIETAQTKTVILIAGAYHVRKSMAVPLHLQLQNSERSPVVVILAEVPQDLDGLEQYLKEQATNADYLWFTPRFTNKDYCEAFRKKTKS